MSEKVCIRLQEDEIAYYDRQYCAEYKGEIKCLPDPQDGWICQSTNGAVRCHNKYDSDYTVDGNCIIGKQTKGVSL